ncbi:MAG: B12-binding domain-containing protein [Treponema sp.]|jgi:methanogenic corrinoid protein MtbC1|nr:B12-binding domain-containing protein [Treponema sp.]
MVDLKEISHSLQSGKAQKTSELISQAIEENYSIENILKQGLIAGMSAVERRFRQNEIFIPDVLVATRAMNMGIKVLKPSLTVSEEEKKGTVIIGTAKGDMQEIDKSLIGIMMLGMGLKVVDLGAGVSQERFIAAAKEEGAQIIVCIASLPTTMPHMKSLVQALNASGLHDEIKVMIYGKPVTDRYAQTIGADFYAPDTEKAAEIAVTYCKKNPALVTADSF